ncbi:MAG: AMP-binding protein [Aeromicrobium sp.]|uniref:AMP-binding protein n=1 Tax=Aeromicrobium sp. TaxID=1871063 RepID=UPI0039E6E8C7
MADLAALLDDAVRTRPERTAVVFGDARISYAEFDRAVNQVANLLVARGVRPGDTVALSCPNVPYFPTICLGLLKAGARLLPLDVSLSAEEIARRLADTRAVACFAFEAMVDQPIGEEAWTAFQAVDSCREFFLVKLDSATPEPLVPPEFYAPLVARQATTFTSAPGGGDETIVLAGSPHTSLSLLPLSDPFARAVVQNGVLATGGTVVLLPRLDARRALGLMAREKVTCLAADRHALEDLLDAADPDTPVASSLRVVVAAEAVPTDLGARFVERFGVSVTIWGDHAPETRAPHAARESLSALSTGHHPQ